MKYPTFARYDQSVIYHEKIHPFHLISFFGSVYYFTKPEYNYKGSRP